MELVDVRLQEPIPCEMSNGENVFGDLHWRSNRQTGSVDDVKCEEVVVKYNVQTSLTRLCHCIQRASANLIYLQQFYSRPISLRLGFHRVLPL
jgi:hypothetical protein